MYASNFILILMTALSAGALALPTNSTHTLHVRKGDNLASVAGYWDKNCYGDAVRGETASDGTPVDAKPTSKENFFCITFNTPAQTIGVNFGMFKSMRAFSDAHCGDDHWLKVIAWPPNTGSDMNDAGVRPDGTWTGAKECVDQQQQFGGKIGSVRFYATADGQA